MRLALAVVALLVFATPAVADAPADVASLMARMQVPVVDDQVFLVEPCPDEAIAATSTGCTFMTPDAVVYITPGFENDWFAVYHELGHRFDTIAMTTRARVRFAGLVGAHSWKWNARMVELFADAYAYCARNPVRMVDDETAPDRPFSQRTHRKVCALIEDVGVRAGLA